MEPSTDNRAEEFRQFVAQQVQAATKSLDTIRTLLILWTVLVFVGLFFAVAGMLAG